MVDFERIEPATRQEWRAWLQAHHDSSPGVSVVYWRTTTAEGRTTYVDLVEEALCFGWIDGRANSFDAERSMIMMTPRKPTGTWARSNKERVERLMAEGLITDAGLRVIEAAKASGSWAILDDIDALVVPDDLRSALALDPTAQGHFDAFPPSAKKTILYWVKSAKRPETRQRRIAETVRLAGVNVRAAQPAKPVA